MKLIDRLLSDKRTSYIFKTGALGLISKASGFIAIFGVAHLLYGVWGAANFGILATLQALSVAMVFADLGLGSSLVNEIISLGARGNTSGVSRAIGYVKVVYLYAALFIVFSALIFGYFFADHLSNQLTDLSHLQAWLLLVLVGFIYSAQLYFGIVQRVNYALSLANRNHWQVISANLCQLLLVWFAVKLGASFYLVIAIVLLTPMVSIVFSYFWTFFITNPGLRTPFGWILDAAVISNLKSGLPFLLINIASIAAFSFDIPLLTATVGSAAAGIFAVNQRLFSVANQASEPFLQLLWPAFQEGLVKGDIQWVKRAFVRALLGVVGITMGIALVIFLTYGHLINTFFSGKAVLNSFTTIGFVIWGIGGGAGGVVSAALSTKNMVPTQFKLVMIAASLCILTKSLLFFGIGGVGHVVWCNALVTICIIVLPGITLFNKKIIHEI